MPSYVLLNTGNHVGLNVGGAVLLNAQAEVIVTSDGAPTYGGGHEYESRVRAWWDEIDRLRAENKAKDEAEREKQERIEARERELAANEAAQARNRSRKATKRQLAVALALEAEIESITTEAEVLRASIEETQSEITRLIEQIEAQTQFDRRRRQALSLLLIAANS
jgi:chromosome segregation ATPase